MQQVELDRVFLALADPTRRAILARLSKGPATVNELASPLPMSQPSVSRHLKVLTEAGLVSRSRNATSRPAMIRGEAMAMMMAWLDQYRSFWEENYRRLDEVLAEMQDTENSEQSDDR